MLHLLEAEVRTLIPLILEEAWYMMNPEGHLVDINNF